MGGRYRRFLELVDSLHPFVNLDPCARYVWADFAFSVLAASAGPTRIPFGHAVTDNTTGFIEYALAALGSIAHELLQAGHISQKKGIIYRVNRLILKELHDRLVPAPQAIVRMQSAALIAPACFLSSTLVPRT